MNTILFPEMLAALFTEANFQVEENEYIERMTNNYKENLHVKRIFVQSKFIKPHKHSNTS